MAKSSSNTQTVFIEVAQQKEIEISVPYYANVQGEDDEVFVKITRDEFCKITISNYTHEINIFKCKFTNNLASIWHINACEKQVWDNALKYVRGTLTKI